MRHIFIIAEAGVNHNGDLETAIQLIDKAVDAGADAVKFQTFKAENLVCRNAGKAQYQMQTTGTRESQFDMLKKLELSPSMHIELMNHCSKSGIKFMSTPFDIESIDLLASYHLDLYKIPSGEITNYPYLKKIGELKKSVILSTGMSTPEEIEAALLVLNENGAKDITLLHCNTEYPTPITDVNLKVIEFMKQKFKVPIGYSDHTIGIEVSIAAAALGASVIEKHFTLDRNMTGPDHQASLEPEELKAMIQSIRNIEKALGSDEKKVSASEQNNVLIVRKSIVAAKDIKRGEILTQDNLTTKRPGTGISPMKWNEVLGQMAKHDFRMDELIEL